MADFGKHTVVKVVGGTLEYRFQDRKRTDFTDRLDRIGVKLTDWRPVFQQYGAYLLRSIDRNFQAQGRPSRWKPLAPATIRERLREGYGAGPILQRSGALRRSFRFEPRPRTLRVWNTKPYFIYHQQGGEIIPQRQMVVVLRQDRGELTRLARKHTGFEQ